VNLPKVIWHRKAEGTICGKTNSSPFYRLAFRVNGCRQMKSFTSRDDAKAEADKKVPALSKGSQGLALTTKEVTAALTNRLCLNLKFLAVPLLGRKILRA